MLPISDTRSLARFCDGLRGADFIAVDTEFIRERTDWPNLSLVQSRARRRPGDRRLCRFGLPDESLRDEVAQPAR
jgi:hypothetical protein